MTPERRAERAQAIAGRIFAALGGEPDAMTVAMALGAVTGAIARAQDGLPEVFLAQVAKIADAVISGELLRDER